MIDGCEFSFHELSHDVLPVYFRLLEGSDCHPMSHFAAPGKGPATILRLLNQSADLPGCYVLWERGEPFYTGISRKIVSRLIQHVRGTTHCDASLAYSMACDTKVHTWQRKKAMADLEFREHFEAAKERIAAMDVKFVQIDNPLERYLFEVYACMELKTHQFNTFETH